MRRWSETERLAGAIKTAAVEGVDTTAMSLWLARLEPPLRPSAQRVQFELDADAPRRRPGKADHVRRIGGHVDPDTGRQLMDLLSAFVGLPDPADVSHRYKGNWSTSAANDGFWRV